MERTASDLQDVEKRFLQTSAQAAMSADTSRETAAEKAVLPRSVQASSCPFLTQLGRRTFQFAVVPTSNRCKRQDIPQRDRAHVSAR
jgi:hypothetical protein